MYKMKLITLVFLFLLLGMFACSHQATKSVGVDDKSSAVTAGKPKNAGMMLVFSEMSAQEPEKDLRMIITDEFLRMDEGPQSQDFLLYDRSKKTIFNVVAEEKSVMAINPPESTLKPAFPMLWIVKSQTSHVMMRGQNADGGNATHHQFLLNEARCYDVVTLDGVLDDALVAIKEYRITLANELKRNYRRAENQTCYEAVNIFDPVNHLQQGFPIREWSEYGYQRFLVDYRTHVIFPADLFALPKDYRFYSQ